MKVIIIGSKGFIGQHLFDYYKDKADKVYGADVIVDYANSANYFLIDPSNADFKSVFETNTYDLCVNCSGAASVPDSLQNPLRDYYLNCVNVFRILEAIKKHQPDCKFINLSSAAVYGNPESLPIEESALLQPLSPYGVHKLQAEQICTEFYNFHGIQTCSLRIFSAYGRGLKKQLFWDLYKKAKSGNPVTLFGTGYESRDFININDLVRAISLVAEKGAFKADLINLANGQEILIKDAVSVFFSFFPNNIQYEFSGDSRKGDPLNWRADISILQSFGYQAEIDMQSGLKEYFQWLEK